MATNEILPFAQGAGANVQSQVDYNTEPLRTSGNVAGIARSNVNNKALRQASVIAAGVAQFMADRQGNNITDSATPANISSWMALAVQSLSSPDLLNTTRIDVASAATVNLTASALNTRNINITGTTTITGFTVAVGQLYFVRFAAALTLTNNANIVTQSGGNITTSAGDTCIIRATAANTVEILCYVQAPNSTALLSANGWQKLPSGLIIQWGTYAPGVTSITFPIAFQTACRSITASLNANIVSNTPGLYNYSTTGFSSASSSISVAWIAIGN